MKRLALAAGGIVVATAAAFEPIQPEALSGAGTFVNAFADYDGDGDVDLFVGFNGAPNRLYRNDGGTLVDVAAKAGVADARPTRAAAWGDADADGDTDLLVGFAPGAGSVLRLYRNTRGHFTDSTHAAGLILEAGAVRQPSFVDIDADGDLDLFVAFRDRANMFFRNDRGRYVDVAAQIGLADTRRSVGAAWFDFDSDGDLDLVVGNMDGDANALYRNDAGRFTDVAEEAGIAWGGRAPRDAANGTVRPCPADVDGDGSLDLFFANYGPNGLFLNRGGRFDDASKGRGVAVDGRYDTCAFADFDNDGRIDVYVNGTVTGGKSYPDFLLANRGAGFEAVTSGLEALNADHGAQWGDVDGDGDEDLALTGVGKEPMPLLFRNLLPARDARRSIRVRLLDRRGRATLAGAEVRAYGAATKTLIGMRLVDSGSGYNSQNDMPVHFGWTGDSRVNIEVTYPAAGRRVREVMRNHDPARSRDTVVIRLR
jgi:hypothetical protein